MSIVQSSWNRKDYEISIIESHHSLVCAAGWLVSVLSDRQIDLHLVYIEPAITVTLIAYRPRMRYRTEGYSAQAELPVLRGISVWEVFVQGGFYPEGVSVQGSLCLEVSFQEGLCLGGLCLGGLCLWGLCQFRISPHRRNAILGIENWVQKGLFP